MEPNMDILDIFQVYTSIENYLLNKIENLLRKLLCLKNSDKLFHIANCPMNL
jgi:hypothetical protein